MGKEFERKNVLITGGAGGVGSCCVRKFLEAGANVAAVDISSAVLRNLEESMEGLGNLKTYVLDASSVNNITETIQSILLVFTKIDVLVQAAGLLQGKSALDITESEWDRILNINAKGTFFIMRETVRCSMQFHGGSIINLSSMAGIRGMRKGMESAHYSASKGAVTALTMQAATEWADKGIRVNCIAPGGIKTKAMAGLKFENALDPVPLGKLSEPEDIANAVLFLAGERSAMITGQTLVIDGGNSIVGY